MFYNFRYSKCRIDRDMFDARKLSIYSQAGIDYVENSYEKDGKKYGSQKKKCYRIGD